MGSSKTVLKKYEEDLKKLEEKYTTYIKTHPKQGCTREIQKLFVLNRIKSIVGTGAPTDIKITQRDRLLAGINARVYPEAFHRAYGLFKNSLERLTENIYSDPDLGFIDWWQEKELQAINQQEKSYYQNGIVLFRQQTGSNQLQKNPPKEGMCRSFWRYLGF